MKDMIRKGLRLALLLIFVISTVLFVRQMLDKRSGSETYDAALAVAMQEKAPQPETQPVPSEARGEETLWIPDPAEDDPMMEEMAQINLAALQEVNPDVIGWIRIPDTQIDYPLLQGQDNELYLKHTWQKEENYVGSVFLEHRNSANLTDYNTIVYAHNMNDGSMFGTLSKYTDPQYRDKHPYIYILSESGVLRYEIFAMYQARVDDPTYGLSFNQLATKAKFMRHAMENSRYDMDVIPEQNDRILTLSTCTSAGHHKRWVVQARLKMVEMTPETP